MSEFLFFYYMWKISPTLRQIFHLKTDSQGMYQKDVTSCRK